ncbi:hypothetical protein [Streptomyces vilmorinianum]|uniref:hypothetical protein n=1 Tax=Streptomyces vilmorinianum TaxID=3051092 RepID=UPI0010FB2038|nr:hypothetical protein [Streptomyces vilmorinianum]
MRTALRTAVATALLAGVAITPALTAGAAFAADVKPADVKPAGTAESAGTLVRTETLSGGTIAKIYKVDALHHRAELFFGVHPVGVLDADTRPAAGNDNGAFFVLFEDGRTLHWTGNYVPGAEPGTYRLADGTVLELAEKDGRYGLQLIENGQGRGFTYLNGDRAVWTYGKAVVVLEQDGGFAAYIPGSTKQAAPALVSTGTPTPKPTPSQSTPSQSTPTPTPTPSPSQDGCVVTQVIPSVFLDDELKIFLTNDPVKGPKAVLKDLDGTVGATVDRNRPVDEANGLKIVGADTATPKLGQRTQGGDTPYRYTDFPKLPKDCAPTTAPSAGHQNTQTTVVPKGGVAAGAEVGNGTDDTALIVAGAGAASVAAAGLGFVALRRRTAGARG